MEDSLRANSGDTTQDGREGYMEQIQGLVESFTNMKKSKELMAKKMTTYEEKIKELENESEKKSAELKSLREERRTLLNDLERSR